VGTMIAIEVLTVPVYTRLVRGQVLQAREQEYITAARVVGAGTERIEHELQGLLRDQLSVGGNAVRGNREKAITILLKTWVSVSDDLKPLRDDGLEHLRRLPPEDHLATHWGMSMTAYPFFGAVAEATGRLLGRFVSAIQPVVPLVSVWAHGSLAAGDYQPGRSDLDLFAIPGRPA